MIGVIIYLVGVLLTLIHGIQIFKDYLTIEIAIDIIVLSLFSWLGLITLYLMKFK